MDNKSTNVPQTKHYKSFWPIIIIITLAILALGIILFKTNENMLEEDINSISSTQIHTTGI